MARRPLHDEPMSKVATWSSRLGLFAFAVAALSIIIVRSGLLEIVPALATFGAALVFAGLAILFAFAAFIVIWRQGLSGLGHALLGLFLGLALLAYPAYLGTRALRLPPISDITTDTANPPRFDVLAR
jgi:cytochrome c biogenesis factor